VFWTGALEAIGGLPRERVEEELHVLERHEFVSRARRSSVAGNIEYAFSHDLMRDVAYGAIPRAARGERHRLAAEWIESLGRPEDHAELLAHHHLLALEYGRATGGDVTTFVERAVQALHRAGERAVRLSANDRAAEHFSHAVDLVRELPQDEARSRTEAELHLQLGVALFALRGFGAPEVERALARAVDLTIAT
jgi:predicted ATPase